MSYYPRKGMWRDNEGNARFADSGQEPAGAAGKRWFVVEITRLHLDSKGKTLRRNVQTCTVFGKQDEAGGLGFRRCPDPWVGEDVGRCATYTEVRPLLTSESLS